jgi:ribonuclease HI
VLSDSKYVISGLTDWIRGWRVRGWLTKEGEPVSNRDLWEQLAEAHEALAKFYCIQFCHVEGHVGQPGNERCDALAVGEANHQPLQLFCVDFKEYPFELQQGLGPLMRGEREEKFSDPYYLSYIDGELQRHSTWKECEMRIKGRRGAKFKKITRPSEERSILESWGLSLLQKS